jgi:hypothetical protein
MNLLKDLKNLASGHSTDGVAENWYITVKSAEGVRDDDELTKSDPYLKVEFGGKHFKTRTINNSRNPVWNETFHFPVRQGNYGDIHLTLMDSDIGLDDSLGKGIISQKDFPLYSGEEKSFRVPVMYKDQICGVVNLQVKKVVEGQNPAFNQQQPMSTQSNYSQQPMSSYSQQPMSTQPNYSQQPMSSSYNNPPNTSLNSQSYQQSSYPSNMGQNQFSQGQQLSSQQPPFAQQYSQQQPFSQQPISQQQPFSQSSSTQGYSQQSSTQGYSQQPSTQGYSQQSSTQGYSQQPSTQQYSEQTYSHERQQQHSHHSHHQQVDNGNSNYYGRQ